MNKDSLKTAIIVILVLVIVIGGSFVISMVGNDSVNAKRTNANHESNFQQEEIPESEQADLTMITIDDYLSLKKGSELSIIYIARPTCGYCQQEEPIVKNLVYLHQLKVNYLNTDTLDEDGFNALTGSDEFFSSGFGTPTIILVKDDAIQDSARGYHTKDELIEFFQKNGLM